MLLFVRTVCRHSTIAELNFYLICVNILANYPLNPLLSAFLYSLDLMKQISKSDKVSFGSAT